MDEFVRENRIVWNRHGILDDNSGCRIYCRSHESDFLDAEKASCVKI